MNGVASIIRFGQYSMLAGAGIYVLALMADGKFLFQGLLGVLLARLPGDAPLSEIRRVRMNKLRWLSALPVYMLFSLKVMRAQHQVTAMEKGIHLGFAYRFMVIWHIFWLVTLGCGYLCLYMGLGALVYGGILAVGATM